MEWLLVFLPSTLCVSRKAEYICLAEWQMEHRFFSINGSRIVKCSDGSVKKRLEKCSGTNDISGFYPQNSIIVDKIRFFIHYSVFIG